MDAAPKEECRGGTGHERGMTQARRVLEGPRVHVMAGSPLDALSLFQSLLRSRTIM